MDGCSRQNPAYRFATENPRLAGVLYIWWSGAVRQAAESPRRGRGLSHGTGTSFPVCRGPRPGTGSRMSRAKFRGGSVHLVAGDHPRDDVVVHVAVEEPRPGVVRVHVALRHRHRQERNGVGAHAQSGRSACRSSDRDWSPRSPRPPGRRRCSTCAPGRRDRWARLRPPAAPPRCRCQAEGDGGRTGPVRSSRTGRRRRSGSFDKGENSVSAGPNGCHARRGGW